MTQNQKIAIGLGALALGYFLFKDKIKQAFTLSAPKGNNSYSAPKQSQATPQQTNPNLEIQTYNCKDGFKANITRDKTKAYSMQFIDPCANHGGIIYDK